MLATVLHKTVSNFFVSLSHFLQEEKTRASEFSDQVLLDKST